jgi:hypothetical protein
MIDPRFVYVGQPKNVNEGELPASHGRCSCNEAFHST